MLRTRSAASVAICSFGRGKHTFAKARGARERFANSRNFDNVYTDGNNH